MDHSDTRRAATTYVKPADLISAGNVGGLGGLGGHVWL